MNYAILLKSIEDSGFPKGYYYAHIPSLGLTTHGKGVDGACEAAHDLLEHWIAEKRASGEAVAAPGHTRFETRNWSLK